MSFISSSFFTRKEIEKLGFKSVGSQVQLSRFARIYNAAAISIGNNVRIDDFCILSGGSGIDLGSHVHVAAYCALYGRSGIVVQDFCGISARTTIYTESDDYSGLSLTGPNIPEKYRTRMQSGPVLVEKHGIIGVAATVMPGVVIGEGAAIGAYIHQNDFRSRRDCAQHLLEALAQLRQRRFAVINRDHNGKGRSFRRLRETIHVPESFEN